ncbi:type II toxin-antitoxin system PemK/MazF family toxin [Arthrobacter sp. RT-1]|uniref:type II toxin-antitoxin system PemK/MazF family toxin n=1 Tax=Arthrobacter sp. RT-1 TaxID=2292263 RepID=UPI000E1F1140|nr:type II toxin-antitoxin system PemK/MazF family toxin [Arthrobacter sp. RT-1]RDV08878.1 type II toxin-antitoxin system PemK/MazF family toxin [Arthrobacter sp. RT-1]
MAINLLRSLGKAVGSGLRLLRKVGRATPPAGPRPAPNRATRGSMSKKSGSRNAASAGAVAAGRPGDAYPGDFLGRSKVSYAPQPDGAPDPGEVVWAWVPYEEDHTRGKDRPVLLVGRSGPYLLGLMLTSRDRVPAASASIDYVDLGKGGWDRQGRPSEARLDRILQIRPDSIRREGAVLDRTRFDSVAAGLRRRHGWS